MNNGKEICRHLKAVRRDIAEQNNIDLQQEECTHEGDCQGTCPKCEQEVQYLEQKLTERKRLGKAVSVIGIAAGIAGSMALTSCGRNIGGEPPVPETGMVIEEPLMGDPAVPDSTETDTTPNNLPAGIYIPE